MKISSDVCATIFHVISLTKTLCSMGESVVIERNHSSKAEQHEYLTIKFYDGLAGLC